MRKKRLGEEHKYIDFQPLPDTSESPKGILVTGIILVIIAALVEVFTV